MLAMKLYIEVLLQNLCLIKIRDLELSSHSETHLKTIIWIQILVEADLYYQVKISNNFLM